MHHSNVLYSIYSMSYCLLTSVLCSIYVISTDVSTAQCLRNNDRMYDCNVLYEYLYSMSVLSTDVSTVQYLRTMCNVYHYCLLMSVLHSVSLLSTDVSTAQYLRTILSNAPLLCTVQY